MADLLEKNPALESLVARRDLILVTGKGGVGKSTVAAALAELAARRRGGAVAVESTVCPRLATMLEPGSNIQVVNIELDKALPALIGRIARLPTIINALLTNRVVRLFLRTAPAVGELVLLDEIRELADANRPLGRPLIVDLPASGHAVALLGTPRAARRLVRVGPVERLCDRLEQMLFDPQRCELVVVALPEELPVNETIELWRRAAELGLNCRTVVVNQVPRPPVEELERAWLDQVREADASALGRVAGAARSELLGVDQARAQIDRLRSAVDGAVIELPRSIDLDPRRRVGALLHAMAS
jgi:arsenite/tail-anchored protein-transporting ATPase